MVHRPTDSRLLANLLSHEKEYCKQLHGQLDSSQASLSSFSAYAAAFPAPTSQVILAVAGAFARSDDVMRQYATSVEEWRETMKNLKDLEDDISTITRDREILVTRLIKVSKAQKPTRESALASHSPRYSSSSLSVHDMALLNTSSKLAAAQAELQACEAQLASKERELDVKRNIALRDGLRVRCRAMVECGRTWREMGKEALRALDILDTEMQASAGKQNGDGGDDQGHSSYDGAQPVEAIQIQKDTSQCAIKALPQLDTGQPSSDVSSISPSQSASQVNSAAPSIPMNLSSIINSNFPVTSQSQLSPPESGHNQTDSAQPGPSQRNHTHMKIPPAHAMMHYNSFMPMSTAGGGYSDGLQPRNHVLPRRITEENMQQQGADDTSSSENEAEGLEQGNLAVVENPRFTKLQPTANGALGHVHQGSRSEVSSQRVGIQSDEDDRSVKSRIMHTFRVLFVGRTPKRKSKSDVQSEKLADSEGRDYSPSAQISSTKASHWQSRTDKNLKEISRETKSKRQPPLMPIVRDAEPDFAPVILPDVTQGPVSGLTPPRSTPRKRFSSDVGFAAKTVEDGPSRLTKKNRAGVTHGRGRSSSVPPRPGESEVRPPVPSLPQNDVRFQRNGSATRRAKEWVGGQRVMGDRSTDTLGVQEMPSRKNSLKKTAGTPAATVMAAGGDKPSGTFAGKPSSPTSTRFSHNSSILSAAGAPPAQTRDKALGQGMGLAPVGRSYSLKASQIPSGTAHKRAVTVDQGGLNRSRTTTGSPERKSSQLEHNAVATTSLMYIVEDVARQNREARNQSQEEKMRLSQMAQHGALLGRSDSTKSALQRKSMLQAPVRLRNTIEVPKAPGSIVDRMRAGGSNSIVMNENGSHRTGDEQILSPGWLPAFSSSQNLTDAGPSERVGPSSRTNGRPTKSPLRSALRNTSRTPSPMPSLPGPSSIQNMYVPTAPGPLVLPSFGSLGDPLACSTPLQPERTVSPRATVYQGDGAPFATTANGTRVQGGQAQDQEDAKSVSSYETGHESITEYEPEDPLAQQAIAEKNTNVLDQNRLVFANGQGQVHHPSQAARPVPQSARMYDVSQGGGGDTYAVQTIHAPQASAPQMMQHVYGDSDMSTSTMSDPHVQPPRRRKSVRVSLNPTFSPTPPAIEDDAREAAWGWQQTTPSPAPRRGTQVKKKVVRRKGSGGGGGQVGNGTAGVNGVWQDSSDEDEGYANARRMLSRATARV